MASAFSICALRFHRTNDDGVRSGHGAHKIDNTNTSALRQENTLLQMDYWLQLKA